MDDSKNRKLGAILSYVSIIASTLIQLLYTPFLIKCLGQSEHGLYSLINSIIGYLTILDLGFGNAIIVYTAKYRAQKRHNEEKRLHGMFFIIYCIIGLIAGLIGIVLYFNVNNLFGSTMTNTELEKAKIMMLILTFNLVITFIFSIYSSILNAYEKFVYQKVISLFNIILKPAIMIPLLLLGYKSITMVITITILNVFVLLSNYIYCKNKLKINIKFSGFDRVLFKTILGYSIWIFLGTIVDKLNWSVDQFVLGAVAGTTSVSIYSVAGQINSLLVNLSTAVSGVLLPKISKMIVNKTSDEEISNEFIKIGRIQFYIVFLMISGIVLFAKDFILWWIGDKFIDSYYCLLFLSIPLSIPLIQNLGISIRQARNKHKFAAIVNMIIAILNLIISIFLAKLYGPIGSAAGTGIGTIVSILIINLYYHFGLKLDMIKFWKNILNMLIINIIPIIFIVIFMNFIHISGILGIIIYSLIYTIVYSIINYLLNFNDYEKNLIKNIIKKLEKKNDKNR